MLKLSAAFGRSQSARNEHAVSTASLPQMLLAILISLDMSAMHVGVLLAALNKLLLQLPQIGASRQHRQEAAT